MTDYDAVVYDLDGTLVRLAVDWDAAAADVQGVFRDAGHDPQDSLWELLERSEEVGLGEAVESVLSDHERAGARRSKRLPLADELASATGPVGVCSLNCEAACREALAEHGLADAVDAVVGRDTVSAQKPDPEPLLATLSVIDVPPDRAVFVGDSERDAVAADRAGVAFRWV
ncbi:MAG: HAD family hydrolase [Halolamina sp.]